MRFSFNLIQGNERTAWSHSSPSQDEYWCLYHFHPLKSSELHRVSVLSFSQVRCIPHDLLALSESTRLVIDYIVDKTGAFGLTLRISAIWIPIWTAAQSPRTLKVADSRSASRWSTAVALSRIVFDWSKWVLSFWTAFAEYALGSNLEANFCITWVGGQWEIGREVMLWWSSIGVII